jgi:hypothetical protein
VRRLAAKITAFLRGLMKPRAAAELDEESEIWDDRERDEFGCLVDSSADPFGLDENCCEATSTDSYFFQGAAEASSLFEDDTSLPFDDGDWHTFGDTTLLPEIARLLAEYEDPLYFDGLLDLRPEAAKAFVHHDWVAFDALTTLSDETAEILAGYQGTCLFLRGLTTLSAKAMAALRSNPRIVLPERFTETPE